MRLDARRRRAEVAMYMVPAEFDACLADAVMWDNVLSTAYYTPRRARDILEDMRKSCLDRICQSIQATRRALSRWWRSWWERV